MHVAIAGAGMAGLGTALALTDAGHRVTLLERDATPLPASPAEAFEWDRRGAPQVRHSHAMLALLRNLLRDRHPDVLAELLAAGAEEWDLVANLPETIVDRSPRPGDDDLVMLACRRTTMEWVLRRTVLDRPGVTLRDGVAVVGVRGSADGPGGVPAVTGVDVEPAGGGPTETIEADLVVAATGRRGDPAAWLAPLGVEGGAETVEDTGIVYLSRFHRLRPDRDPPPRQGPIGGDLGYLKYAVFPGDNGTFSMTLAVRDDDRELRAALRSPEAFDRACGLLVATAPWVAPGLAEPLTDVHVMAGLLNRHRRFVTGEGDQRRPVVTGFAAVGDAAVCTNPLYGRGCALGVVHGHLLADALDEHPDDPVGAALAFDEATERDLTPWYRAAVASDRSARAAASSSSASSSEGGGGGGANEGDPMAEVMREGLMAAARTDADVFRAFLRGFNLLAAPEALVQDATVVARVMEAYQARDERPPEPSLGPDRADLLVALG